jgi:hypothetical protein
MKKTDKVLGELLIYNSPKGIIISRNKIASRVLDKYYNTYIAQKVDELLPVIELTEKGENFYKRHSDNLDNVQTWFVQYVLFNDSGIGAIQKSLASWVVKDVDFNIVVEPLREIEKILHDDVKIMLKTYFTKKSVTDIINFIEQLYYENKEEVEKAFAKKSKKDIFVFYREPNRRIISGAIQDFFGFFSNLNSREQFWFDLYLEKYSKFDYSFIKAIFDSEESLIPSDIIRKIDKHAEQLDSNTNKDYYQSKIFDFVKPILEKYLVLQHRTYTHSSPYLFIINEFLQIFDKNKVKLINLDANRLNGVDESLNLHDVLSPLYEFENSKFDVLQEKQEQLLQSNDRWIEVLTPIISLDTKFENIINSEMFYYGRLVRDKSNFYKIEK